MQKGTWINLEIVNVLYPAQSLGQLYTPPHPFTLLSSQNQYKGFRPNAIAMLWGHRSSPDSLLLVGLRRGEHDRRASSSQCSSNHLHPTLLSISRTCQHKPSEIHASAIQHYTTLKQRNIIHIYSQNSTFSLNLTGHITFHHKNKDISSFFFIFHFFFFNKNLEKRIQHFLLFSSSFLFFSSFFLTTLIF